MARAVEIDTGPLERIPGHTGKATFLSEIEAITFRNRKMREPGGEKLYVYRCNYCRGWHLTRMKQPKMDRVVE